VSHVEDLRIGSDLAGYRVVSVLGRGGMSVVYLAEDLRLKRRVALKLLAPALAADQGFRERFLAESELAASIDHPNIVPVYEAGEADGRLFIAMRYVEGEDLAQRLRGGRLEPAEAVGLVGQVAAALDAAHAHGLVHRDVKPSNALIAPAAAADGGDHVYLADFGLTVTSRDGALAAEAGLAGTVDYVAPEQIQGERVTDRADVYALGCVLYECLVGRPPFAGPSEVATIYAHLEEEPPSASEHQSELPKAIDAVLARALAKTPEERYSSCRELIRDARAALGLAEPHRARWPTALAALGTVLIGAALLAYFLDRSNGIPAESGADTLIHIDPGTNASSAAGVVGRQSSAVASGGGYVWVTSFQDGTVWRIDPKTGKARVFPTEGSPSGVAADANSAVVVNGPGSDSVVALDAATGAVRGVTPLPGDTQATPVVAGGAHGLWFADAEQRLVTPAATEVSVGGNGGAAISIPAETRNLLGVFETFDGMAVGAGGVWIAGDVFGRSVWRVDPAQQRLVERIDLAFIPKGIAAGEGAVWVTSLLDDTVARIDPATGRVTATIRVGRGADAVAIGLGAVWVANDVDATISRIDPRRAVVVATIPLTGPPVGVAVAGGRVWAVVRS
jgi:YVTN family beta-propeller protein